MASASFTWTRMRTSRWRENIVINAKMPAARRVQCHRDRARASRHRGSIFCHHGRRASRRKRSRSAAMKRARILGARRYAREGGDGRRITARNFSISSLPRRWWTMRRRRSTTSSRMARTTSDGIVTANEADRRALPRRGGFSDGLLECLDALHRWRRVWFRRGDRDFDGQTARARPDGAGGIDDLQVSDARHRARSSSRRWEFFLRCAW